MTILLLTGGNRIEYSECMNIRAVLFDAYGTLFDVHSVAVLAEHLFAGQGQNLSQLWRDKQIEYTRLVSMSAGAGTGGNAHYRPFWDLTRAGLRYAAERLQLSLDPEAEERLMNEYRQLGIFPEVHEVLTELNRRGIPSGVLSNGDPGMLTQAVRNAGLAPLLQHVLSVDVTRRYKTDPAAYAIGPAALGMSAKEILFVSSNCWDAIGATWFGYTTLWVNRAAAPLDRLDTEPSRTGRSLREVLDLLPTSD
jgi:2-haloacid dehalogenase